MDACQRVMTPDKQSKLLKPKPKLKSKSNSNSKQKPKPKPNQLPTRNKISNVNRGRVEDQNGPTELAMKAQGESLIANSIGEKRFQQNDQLPSCSKLSNAANLDADNIKYWHYKQTGIKSRPIKLIKHPIEHIERKIILSYFLAFIFKLIAILTGPLIVLSVYFILVPWIVSRRLVWFLCNLSFLFDARIQTSPLASNISDEVENKTHKPEDNNTSDALDNDCDDDDNDDDYDDSNTSAINIETSRNDDVGTQSSKNWRQIFWSYCPLNCYETYWLKENQVNNIVLELESDNYPKGFSVDKLRLLIRRRILDKAKFRKFGARIVARGIPLYKSFYWNYLGFRGENDNIKSDESNPNIYNNNNNNNPNGNGNGNSNDNITSGNDNGIVDCLGSASSLQATCSTLGPSKSSSVASIDGKVKVSLASAEHEPSGSNNSTTSESETINCNPKQLNLADHIYTDKDFEIRGSVEFSIKRHVYWLSSQPLDMSRPLWEIRVVDLRPASGERKRQIYLLVRCHQSLADGKSLISILKCNLTRLEPTNSTRDRNDDSEPDSKRDSDDDNDEKLKLLEEQKLMPIGEKRSFVERVSSAASFRSAVFVGPLTILLWFIWSFTRRKNNHLNRCKESPPTSPSDIERDSIEKSPLRYDNRAKKNCATPLHEHRRFHWSSYNLTRFHQIKQMTRSTVSDIILCALSGALRDYLRKFNCINNPPNLNISLAVDMRQPKSKPTLGSKRPSDGPQVDLTIINVPLPSAVEGTVPRLWEIRNTMDELRHSADPWVMVGLQQILFTLLPKSWYQMTVNWLTLRNSSIFVSNIRGPRNVVESWCVNLFQRAILEAQQPPTIYKPSDEIGENDANSANQQHCEHSLAQPDPKKARLCGKLAKLRSQIAKQNKSQRCEFLDQIGSIKAIYYCMQPPTSNIPVSFNCITYHNRLFVTSLSHSLLVEDSKLLINLFFGQLDRMANSIAKRRSLVAIVRHPPKVSIDNAPLDVDQCLPTQSGHALIDTDPADGVASESQQAGSQPKSEQLEGQDPIERRPQNDGPKPMDPVNRFIQSRGQHKDDLEANIGVDGRTSKCNSCQQFACICRRRKSLFSADNSTRQGLVNSLVTFWLPNQLGRPRGSGSNMSSSLNCNRQQAASPDLEGAQGEQDFEEVDGVDGVDTLAAGKSHRLQLECLCGQLLLEELDHEPRDMRSIAHSSDSAAAAFRSRSIDDNRVANNNTSAAQPMVQRQHSNATSMARFNCPKCRSLVANERSPTVSLNASGSDISNKSQQQLQQTTRSSVDSRYQRMFMSGRQRNAAFLASRTNASSLDISPGTIIQLTVPHSSKAIDGSYIESSLDVKAHSRSESDLIPANRVSATRIDGSQRDVDESMKSNQRDHSWFNLGRKAKARQHRISSIKGGVSHGSSTNSQLSNAARSHQEISIQHPKRSQINPAARRQSLAAITGLSSTQGSIVIKDEVSILLLCTATLSNNRVNLTHTIRILTYFRTHVHKIR